MINKIDKFCFNTFPNADIKVGALASGGGGTPIEIKVSGDDPDIYQKFQNKLKPNLLH